MRCFVKFIIHVYPLFYCLGLTSGTVYKKGGKDLGTPIVSITYDGTRTNKNKVLKLYLHFLR